MELQCVESLGPDAAQTLQSLPVTNSQHDPNTRSSPLNNNIRPYHTLSPLTCTPTSSPKRRRISYISPSFSTLPNSSTAASPPLSHPLTSLAERDVRYAIKNPSHLQKTSVTPEMREEVVAWCSDMTEDLNLAPAIVAIAINLFDRFLMRQSVSKTLLYPLTASCLLLACKVLMDEDVPYEEIASRSRVTVEDIHTMESVVLNVLHWEVNVATPHEVVYELSSCFKGQLQCHKPLLECLLLSSLSDYGLAWLRATSIGVACFALCSSATRGEAFDATSNPVFRLAIECNVDMDEVKYCIAWLRESMHALFGEVESCDSE